MAPRPFHLMVDSGARDEPPSRYFGSLDAAYKAMSELDSRWLPFVWITEERQDDPIVHVRDGRRVVRWLAPHSLVPGRRCSICGTVVHVVAFPQAVAVREQLRGQADHERECHA